MGAVVSEDHADASMCVAHLATTNDGRHQRPAPRLISPDEVKQHGGREGPFWAVVDGFVVDASTMVDSHPGGLRKLLSTDSAATGATGREFGFSFSKGRNAHFPDTGKRFHEGVQRYLNGEAEGPFLAPAEVAFPPYGGVVILGRLGGM